MEDTLLAWLEERGGSGGLRCLHTDFSMWEDTALWKAMVSI